MEQQKVPPGKPEKIQLASTEEWRESEGRQQEDAVGEHMGGSQTQNTDGTESLLLTTSKRFCGEASIVGLRYVASPSASPFRRSAWALLLLFGAGFTAFQIQDRVRYFLARPVSINLRIQHADEIRFPTVTVCNENRITRSAAKRLGNAKTPIATTTRSAGQSPT